MTGPGLYVPGPPWVEASLSPRIASHAGKNWWFWSEEVTPRSEEVVPIFDLHVPNQQRLKNPIDYPSSVPQVTALVTVT